MYPWKVSPIIGLKGFCMTSSQATTLNANPITDLICSSGGLCAMCKRKSGQHESEVVPL